jgi:hypothetical protein
MFNPRYRSVRFFISMFLLVILAACHKDIGSVFNQTTDERLTASLAAYQKTLSGAPGWKVFVYPQGLKSKNIDVGGFTYYMKFNDSNRVSMVSDFSTDYAASPFESSFRLKAVQRPSIYFDTYSFIHVPADPSANINGSPAGADGFGWGTDYDFSFADNGPSDTIHLKGNFNKSQGVMIKARAGEMDSAFSKGRLLAIMNNTYNYANASPFLYFQASASQKVAIGFDFNLVNFSFTYVDGSGNIVTIKTPFSFTNNGLYLKAPVTIGTYTFQEIYWDDVRKIYYILPGGTRVDFANNASPIVSFSLTNSIGSSFTTISVPTTPLPNQSPLFASKYTIIKNNIKAGPYQLDLNDMDFTFNAASKTMILYVYIYQGSAGYVASYNFIYTVDCLNLQELQTTVTRG